MPARNTVKQFIPDAYYHIYNRGVEKRDIFCDKQDYLVFLSYLKTYLEPKERVILEAAFTHPLTCWADKDKLIKLMRLNNFYDTLKLVSYCLMSNHFHLLVKQGAKNTIDKFMNSLCTRYSMYFNRKYKRVGPLFQGVYKAVLVETDEQLLYLSAYIHRNPLKILQGIALQNYQYSSYAKYLGLKKTRWINSQIILANFAESGVNSYRSFVEDEDSSQKIYSSDTEPLLLDHE